MQHHSSMKPKDFSCKQSFVHVPTKLRLSVNGQGVGILNYARLNIL